LCSETRPNAKPETVSGHCKATLHRQSTSEILSSFKRQIFIAFQ